MWQFLNTGFHSADFNMDLDETLAREFDPSACDALLRVYGWKPFAVSIGAHQNVDDFDKARLAEFGYDIVRRPTGGRAILHAHELTYSVVMDARDRGVREIYRHISEGLLAGVRLLGIPAQLMASDEHLTTPFDDPSSIPCFSSSAKCEIQCDGKKLVGSAQRRYGSIVLQHGSLLLGAEHRHIVDLLAPHVQSKRSILEDHLAQRTLEAEIILGRSVSFEEAADCIRRGFERAWKVTFTESSFAGTLA